MKLSALFSLVGFTIVASAGVLVDKGPFDPTAPAPNSNLSHADGNQWQASESFTTSTNVAIRHIDFRGLYGNRTNGPTAALRDDFTIRVFADTNGAPDIYPIAEYRIGRVSRRRGFRYTHSFFGPYYFYTYSAALHPVIMLPAGQYWLSIVNDISVEETGVTWAIAAITPSDGNLHFRSNDGESWFKSGEGYGIAFKLRGVKER